MKKLFLMLVAAVSFNANAALISLTTDKDVYNVGETVTVTVSLTNLLNGPSQTLFSAYATEFNFDTTLLQYVDGSLESLMPFGGSSTFTPMALPNFLMPTFSGVVAGNNVLAQSIGGLGMSAPQFGGNTVALYTADFIAVALGENLTPFAFLQSQFQDASLNPLDPPTMADSRTATFSVAEVPAPSTLLLSLLALAGVAVARSRKQS